MATLDDLPIPSLLDLSQSEGLQLILDVRLRRALVIEPTREPRAKSKRQPKSLPSEAAISQMSEKQITDLYYALMAKQQKELL